MTRKAPAEDPGDARLRVGPPKEYAAGIPAVTSSLRHAGEQMGACRSLLTLLQVNQKAGFDCTGCAEHTLEEPLPRSDDWLGQQGRLTHPMYRHEAAFLYRLFVRSLGTNNLPDCSNMCHESSGPALTQTIGVGKGSVRLEPLPADAKGRSHDQNP